LGKPHARFDERGQVKTCSLLYPKSKTRDAKTLEADVDEILAGFGEKYKLDFC
jgi:hypothetical protein